MKPIGYWLNRADQALTRHMNGMLEEFGLTRLSWQVLNVVQDAPNATGAHDAVQRARGVTDGEVLSVLAANAGTPALTAAIDAVLTGGWAARPAPGRLVLTPDGAERLARVAERVGAFRDLSMTGISPDEYRTAVSVLERMTANLEPARAPHLPA
ncbi:MarR family winged helix-turn-helix transcriptional regulator [Nonomuraea sp. 3-1Str]|uniref:MarR family winged helix-turn-helix transcriptional regulator n=1 Tax=Nonomuraea sp. 3-1Str TaxID=2929801 RepID=UPI00286712E0|nr:MarR family winged helix-turn-helix transcriptional regulator [Nonomuraea sp. 3-1Str]MDR8410107.1 MarR family winged helix-turn-helix transcriptional regulator [Nonomuraea sp. 3-1Str]